MLMRVGEQRTCLECHGAFTVTSGEANYFVAVKGLAIPKRCPECRRRRRRPGCDQPIRAGVVENYCERGFAFIQPDDGGPNVFCHIEVQPALPAMIGRRVKFAAVDAERGPRATWCEPESPAAGATEDV